MIKHITIILLLLLFTNCSISQNNKTEQKTKILRSVDGSSFMNLKNDRKSLYILGTYYDAKLDSKKYTGKKTFTLYLEKTGNYNDNGKIKYKLVHIFSNKRKKGITLFRIPMGNYKLFKIETYGKTMHTDIILKTGKDKINYLGCFIFRSNKTKDDVESFSVFDGILFDLKTIKKEIPGLSKLSIIDLFHQYY